MNKKLFSLLAMVSLIFSLLPAATVAAPPAQQAGTVYTIQKDDWLSKLADKEYGDPLAYPAIVYYNNLKAAEDSTFTHIEDPEVIEVGWTIYIPTAEEATTFLAGEVTGAFVFGMILVGPFNDHGWSEAHYTAGQYVETNLPGARMIWLDKLNPADRPETTLEQAVDDMVAQGAQMILTTSDDFQTDTDTVAAKYPNIPFLMISGDHALTGVAPSNVANYMGRMEYGKMMAGCAAALKTETGIMGYLGPLINDETRRLANSVYLGARYCYENYRGKNPDDLQFIVQWIGFWFNIPGVTLDPTEVANDIFNAGADVILSGIDTTEAIVVAGQRAEQGDTAWAIPYDYEGACAEAPDVCLGVPYFNWGPAYVNYVKKIQAGTFAQEWVWAGPDWTDINNRDTTAVGFIKGNGLGTAESAQLDEFIAGLARGSINLFVGPLNYQDGSTYLADGEVATDEQIWYSKQLLEGMTGPSE